MKKQPTERIRGRALQRIRDEHRRKFPLCAMCLKKDPPEYRVWTQLDHIIPLDDGGPEIESNRQGLCVECHEIKTAQDFNLRSKRLRPRIGFDGFPIKD